MPLCNARIDVPHRTNVKVTNVLGRGTDLAIYCRDKKHDLGKQVVKFGESWEFRFKPDFWGTTLYHCTLQWDYEFKYFNIYVEVRDVPRCHRECWWHIRKDIACLMNWDTWQYDQCQDYVNGP
uniref:S-protein homolog n=1 Tax=Kalanchoe fedtschenkoi TaxID=63787 RepID=A0A7N0USF3_KALFE